MCRGGGGGSTRRLVEDIRPPRWRVFLWTGGAGPLIKWAGLELRKVAVCARLKKSLHYTGVSPEQRR